MLRNIRMKILLGSLALVLTTPVWGKLWTYEDDACSEFYWTVPNVEAYHAWKKEGLVASYIDSKIEPPICKQ